MEFSKGDTQTLILALGVAIEKERCAIETLGSEIKTQDIAKTVQQREQHLLALERLQEQLKRR